MMRPRGSLRYKSPVIEARRNLAANGMDFLATMPVRSVAGGRRGSMSNFIPQRLSRYTEALERQLIQDRADDLVRNDPYAAGTIESMSVNVVGTGIRPQANPNFERLGIDEEQAEAFSRSAEWIWKIWKREADASGWRTFDDILFTNFRSILIHGDMVNLQVMLDDPGRMFSLALQTIHPQRLRTPVDLVSDSSIREGVVLGGRGEPTAYWIANPDDGILQNLTSKNFVRQPLRNGHRNVVYHRFYSRDPEQVRGVSVLAPAMKSFRDLSDYLNFELVANVISASFPLFIETPNPEGVMGATLPGAKPAADTQIFNEYEEGQIMYGRPGEKPHVLESNRPGNNFAPFVERVLRGLSAATNMPYEVLAKDFSKTNYSSARAALLEAWRVYTLYRSGLINWFCQPVYEQLLEEAFLRGLLDIPAGAPDFYEAKSEWCNALWIGAARGHVDPVKETDANHQGLEDNSTTLSSIVAEQGGDDWEAVMRQRGREVKLAKELGIYAPPKQEVAAPASGPEEREA